MTRQSRMQSTDLPHLPLHRLLSAARQVRRDTTSRTVRLALLGDAATQHYARALDAALKLRGCWPEIYESEFDTIRQEVFGDTSGLRASGAQVVILFHTTQALGARHAAATGKEAFPEEVVGEITALWAGIRDRLKAAVIQHTFVVPIDRPYGNQTPASRDTLASAILRLNARLIEEARAAGVPIIDTEWEASYHGKRTWFDERLWCQARQALSPACLPSLAKAASDVVLAGLGAVIKCVVVDLDNTLWGGVLGDDGPERIEIGPTELGLVFTRVQQALAILRDRGILLAVCSRNMPDAVHQVLSTHPDMVLRPDDFAIVVANHDDKVSNLLHIGERLGIGLDSLMFLDDNPFEREMVRQALPAVLVPELPEDPAGVLDAIARSSPFEAPLATAEDRARAGYYQRDAERQALRVTHGDLNDYLVDLRMVADVLPFNAYTMPRVHQLVQRSNQFNLTTIRYTLAELTALSERSAGAAFCLRLTDRLGDNGIIAVIVASVAGADLVIDSWIMSCRVLGRGVEALTHRLIVERAAASGCTRVIGRYAPTDKNRLVADLYPGLGFSSAGSDGGALLFEFPVAGAALEPGPIAIRQPLAMETE